MTGLSLNSIANIRRRWRQQGLRSLGDRPRTGRPPVVTDAYLGQLRRPLRRGPRAFGYVFTLWSIARLRAHLQRLNGVSISTGWLRRLTHNEGWSIGRPKHPLANKRNGRVRQGGKASGDAKKGGACKRTRLTSCGTPDATTFQLLPHLART